MDNSSITKGSSNQDPIHVFLCRQLSKLDPGIYELARQHPDKTILIARQLDEFQDDINGVVRRHLIPTCEIASSPTYAGANKLSVEGPPSAILADEQLNDLFTSDMVPNMVNYDLSFPELASGIDESLGFSYDGNAMADLSATLCHDEVQNGEISIIIDNNNLQQITTSQELQGRSQSTTPIHPSSRVEIGDENLCEEVTPLGHSSESSTVVQSPQGSRKRTANELSGTSSTFNISNKQRSRSDRTRHPQNLSHELSASSDKVTRDLYAFLDRHKVTKPASRSTLLKCVGCLREFSPLHHLNEILRTMRKETGLRLLPTSTDIAATNEKLDQLDRLSSTCSVLRMVYLVRLLEHRGHLEGQLKDEGSNPSLRKNKGCNKLASLVLERMLEDLYPTKASGNFKEGSHFKEPHLKKRLHNNLTAARKWSFIHDKFSLGMLFLIPAGADYGINNQDIEWLSKETIQHLFDFIFTHQGDTLQRFAKAITPHLRDILDGKITQRKFKFELLGHDDMFHVSRDQGKLLDACALDDDFSSG